MLSAGLFQLLNLRALGVKRNAIRLSEMTGRVVGKSTITESLLVWPNDGERLSRVWSLSAQTASAEHQDAYRKGALSLNYTSLTSRQTLILAVRVREPIVRIDTKV